MLMPIVAAAQAALVTAGITVPIGMALTAAGRSSVDKGPRSGRLRPAVT